jgi:hypothetical protein
VLSSVTLDDNTGTPVALHTDTPTSQAVLVSATGLVGIGPLRSSKRVRPSAHGGIDETRFEEGRGPAFVGEVMSTTNIEDCLAVFRALTRPMLETLDNGPALLKWTEGAGGTNPVYNPSFVHDGNGATTAAGWITSASYFLNTGATLKVFVIPKYASASQIFGLGSYCQFTTAGTLVNEGMSTSEVIPVIKNVPITIYFSVYDEVSQEFQVMLGSSTVGQTSAKFTQTAAAGWARHSVTLTPTETGLARFALRSTGAAKVMSLIFTAVSDEEPYFDGDSPGAEWEGVPGNAVSSSGKNLQMLVRLDSDCEPVLSGGAAHLNYQASFYAEDPCAYSQTLTSVSSSSLATSGGGLIFPAPWPWLFNTTGRGSVTIAQEGNRPSPLVFRVHGEVVNPRITRLSDGASLTLKGSVAGGDYLGVDTAARTVLLNGATNLLNFIDATNTNWAAFAAPPSPFTETYTLNADGNNGEAFLECLYRSAYA